MSIVVWDAETDTSFKMLEGMPREQAMHTMQFTVISALEFKSEDAIVPGNWEQALKNSKQHTFWRDVAEDGKDPLFELLNLFDRAEVIVAYNGLGFDFPVIRKHYGSGKTSRRRYLEHRLKTLDPMLKLAQATDMPYVKLDKLLEWNKLPRKIGSGLEAIKLWEESRRDELEAYCAQDVASLANLVHLDKLSLGQTGWLPNRVHGVASALMAERALQPVPLEEEEFVLVSTGNGCHDSATN